MSLGASDRRLLALIEADLCQSDPALAAEFARFSRPQVPGQATPASPQATPASPQPTPAPRQGVPDPRPAGPAGGERWWRKNAVIALVLLCVAAAIVLLTVASSGRVDSSGCGPTTPGCAKTNYACHAGNAFHHVKAKPLGCHTPPPPNAP